MSRERWIYGGVLVGASAFFAVAVASYLSPGGEVVGAPASADAVPLPGDPNRVDKPSFTNMPAVSATATASASADSALSLLFDCDDDDLYGDNLDANNGDQKKAEAATLAAVKKWTPACRRAAFESNCGTRCWDWETDRLIQGAASKAEARELRAERLKRNTAAIKALDPLILRVRAIVKHANAINRPGRTTGAECGKRMGEDFRAADALKKEIDDALGDIPIGLMGLKSTLAYAKGCLDCSDDRTICKDMNDDMKSNEEIIADWKKMNATDAAALR